MFCLGTSLKKPIWPRGDSILRRQSTLDEWEKTVLLNSGLDASFFGDAWWSRGYSSSRPCDAGSSPQVVRWVFPMRFHDKILLFI